MARITRPGIPATDKLHRRRNTRRARSPGRRNCRDALLEELGLDENPRGPVFCMVTRLAEQKGFDILIPLLDRLLADDVRLVILGEGDADYSRELDIAAKRNAGPVCFRGRRWTTHCRTKFTRGADMMLIPSHFEPCGLGAMYALKYGTVPIARASGGLHQILTDYDPTTETGNAFLFYEYTTEALWDSIGRAKRHFADEEAGSAWRGKAWSAIFHGPMRRRSMRRFTRSLPGQSPPW